ncbi:MAG: hypothetical protein ACOVMR_12015 [Flavobacteriales bacterium]|jgi:hypothetical protein
MLKSLLSVIAGVIAGVVVISLAEGVMGTIYPFPEGTDMNNMEALKAAIALMPAGAFLMVMGGHLIGSMASGMVASLIMKTSIRPALICGGIFTAFGLINLISIGTHPWWMWSELAFYLPMAYLGHKIVTK